MGVGGCWLRVEPNQFKISEESDPRVRIAVEPYVSTHSCGDPKPHWTFPTHRDASPELNCTCDAHCFLVLSEIDAANTGSASDLGSCHDASIHSPRWTRADWIRE